MSEIREGEAEHNDEDANERDDDPELIPDNGAEGEDDLSEAIQAAAECRTVTAGRLQGVTLGRKFCGKPKSIEERILNSCCAACGARLPYERQEG